MASINTTARLESKIDVWNKLLLWIAGIGFGYISLILTLFAFFGFGGGGAE